MNKKKLEKYINKNGLRMNKCLNVGGIFTNATYDRRTIYSIKELYELNRQGFGVEENIGLFILNAILEDET